MEPVPRGAYFYLANLEIIFHFNNFAIQVSFFPMRAMVVMAIFIFPLRKLLALAFNAMLWYEPSIER